VHILSHNPAFLCFDILAQFTNERVVCIQKIIVKQYNIFKLSEIIAQNIFNVQYYFTLTISVTINLINIKRDCQKICASVEKQKQNSVNMHQDFKENLQRDPQFTLKVITGDETWLYRFNAEAKHQLSQRKSPSSLHVKIVRQVRSSVTSMSYYAFQHSQNCVS
jgi:hypothetical protein